MEYTYPKFFYDFQCEASACSDTCCAGWGIAIDPVSLKKYRNYPGIFGSRLKNSIDWETGSFRQYEGRCAFLSEENLCDIYTEAGEKMLCKTCTRYPRHYEEYENLREISLSLSCPAAARLILGSDEKMTFLSECRETPEEEYEQFDFFLFTKLQEIRDYLYQVIQDRERPVELRMAMILAAGHDLQSRITRQKLYMIDNLLKWYGEPSFEKLAGKKFRLYDGRGIERRVQLRRMWRRLYRLEALRPEWTVFLKRQEQRLYQELSQEAYEEVCREFAVYHKEKEYEYEQLLMYFIFSYVCGAVYDGDVFSKIKLAVVNTMLIRELNMAVWLEKDRQFTLEDQIENAYRYAREVEHSDQNMEAMECMLAEEELFELANLLTGILGINTWKEKTEREEDRLCVSELES
ncbi:MAG: flagellin lysine-N-methylase [Clostridiales bacterium]|nr:flagellin lysine-N-methylase [Clostridiales bacterium]